MINVENINHSNKSVNKLASVSHNDYHSKVQNVHVINYLFKYIHLKITVLNYHKLKYAWPTATIKINILYINVDRTYSVYNPVEYRVHFKSKVIKHTLQNKIVENNNYLNIPTIKRSIYPCFPDYTSLNQIALSYIINVNESILCIYGGNTYIHVFKHDHINSYFVSYQLWPTATTIPNNENVPHFNNCQRSYKVNATFVYHIIKHNGNLFSDIININNCKTELSYKYIYTLTFSINI